MTKYPRLRCPVCGMAVFLRNVEHGKMHSVDVLIYDMGGRGRIKIEKQIGDMELLDFWIQRLEEVLDWLDRLKGKVNLRIASPLVNLRASGASVTYVSTQIQERLRLSSTVDRVRLTSSRALLRIS